MNLWTRDGVITLVATLLGVFLALYLNEWNSSRKLKNQKQIASKNILLEINSNKEKLEESVENYTKMLETFIFFKHCINSKGDVVSSVEYMSKFISKNPGIIYPKDSIKLMDGKYKYTQMDLNLHFIVEQVELRTIAWETMKNSNIISSYNFDYLMNLEYFYNSLKLIIQSNKEIYDDAAKFLQSDFDVLDNLIFNIKIEIDTENNLIDFCNNKL